MTIRLLFFILFLFISCKSQLFSIANGQANFQQQISDIVQGIKTLQTPQGKLLKQKLLNQIFNLHGTLDKYKSDGVTLNEVRLGVKNILLTIKEIQDKNYEQDSKISGQNNSAYGSDNSATGKSNRISGDNSYVEGLDNRLVGDNTFAAGNKSYIIGDNTFAIGSNMTVRGDNTVAFAARGAVKGNNRMALDKFNIDVEALNTGATTFLTVFN